METATKTIAPELVGTWDIDPAHSTVEAVARYAMLTSVRGRFPNFKGIMAAKKKPLQVLSLADLGVSADAAATPRTIMTAVSEKPPRAAGVFVLPSSRSFRLCGGHGRRARHHGGGESRSGGRWG